jgi:hypothetical protein
MDNLYRLRKMRGFPPEQGMVSVDRGIIGAGAYGRYSWLFSRMIGNTIETTGRYPAPRNFCAGSVHQSHWMMN